MRNNPLSKSRWLALAGCLLFAATAAAQGIYVLDLLERPERFFNTVVTVVGQVQSVEPSRESRRRGTYAIVDDSTRNPLTVRSQSLPKIGRIYRITGTLLADPARNNAPILKEEKRAASGASRSSTVLIAAGILLAALLALFIVLWRKQQSREGEGPSVRTVSQDLGKTIRVPPPSPAAGAAEAGIDPAKTQVYRNLGASLVLESGPDKGRVYMLHLMKTTIGRPGGRLNDIEIADGTMSKEQASLLYDNAKKDFTLLNESATNPTLLDGVEIAGPTLLHDGAAVGMGKVVLRFKVG